MMNPADGYAHKTFSQIESQVSRQYREAYKDILKKMADFTRRHKAKDKQMQRDLKNGKITQEQYASWLKGQVFIGQQWQSAKASIDATIKNVMNEASSLTHQKSIDVFVDNANYTAYQIEKDFNGAINFDLYDRKTVSRLILEDPELLPRRKDIDGNKLEAWNTKTISNCIFQAITQGESIDELSKRIARDTSIDAGRSSLLYARTAMTGAQNAGRIERMKEAQSMGIKVQKQWMSTLDSRTRDSHRDMDGEIAGMDDEFSNGLEYPGDPNGPGREVYNCRCTLIYHYPGYSNFANMERTAYYEEGDPEYDPRHRNYETVKGMNYEQWVNYKQDQIRQRCGEEQKSTPNNIVAGVDINTPHYEAFSDNFVKKIPEWADEIENSNLPSYSEQFEYYKIAKTETDKELIEFIAQLEGNVLTYRTESEESQKKHAEIFSVIAKPHNGKLYRGESGEWVKTYGNFDIGKTITFEHLSFTSPDTKTPFAHTGVIWEFESGTKSINFVGQDEVDDDELILGKFVIVKKTIRNGVPVVTLKQVR